MSDERFTWHVLLTVVMHQTLSLSVLGCFPWTNFIDICIMQNVRDCVTYCWQVVLIGICYGSNWYWTVCFFSPQFLVIMCTRWRHDYISIQTDGCAYASVYTHTHTHTYIYICICVLQLICIIRLYVYYLKFFKWCVLNLSKRRITWKFQVIYILSDYTD